MDQPFGDVDWATVPDACGLRHDPAVIESECQVAGRQDQPQPPNAVDHHRPNDDERDQPRNRAFRTSSSSTNPRPINSSTNPSIVPPPALEVGGFSVSDSAHRILRRMSPTRSQVWTTAL